MAKKMSKAQLDALKKEYSKLKTVDPSSPTYKRMVALLDVMPLELLKQIEAADIPFLSSLARNRVTRKSKTVTASVDPVASLYELAGTERDYCAELVEAASKAFVAIKKELGLLGIVITYNKDDNEYTVNYKGGKEKTAYYTDDLEDAYGTGKLMAAKKSGGMAKASEETETASTGLAGQLVEPTAGLINGLKQKCAEQGMKIRARKQRGSLNGSVLIVIDKANEDDRRKFMALGKTLGLVTSTYKKFDDPNVRYSWNGTDQIGIRFTKQSKQVLENMGISTASAEHEITPVAPSAVILAATIEKARLGNSVTTYELLPLINRLAHADLSVDEIADRFTEAFGDILLPQE